MPNLDPRFQKAQEEYARLKAQLSAGQLTPAQFESALDQLMMADDQGRYWMIGAETGKWYVHNGQTWVEGTPGGAVAPAVTSAAVSGSVPPAPSLQPPAGRPATSGVEQGSLGSRPVVDGAVEPAMAKGRIRVVALVAFIGVFLLVLLLGLLAVPALRQALGGLFGGPSVALGTATPTPAARATSVAVGTPPATPVPATSAPVPSIPATSAPTLAAPTTAATQPAPTQTSLPPAATATLPPAPTAVPPTVAPPPTVVPPSPLPPRPTATAAPSFPPGVYVTRIRADPPDPKRNQDVTFFVTFVNTSGEPRSYTFLVWTYYENGKGLGETPVKGITVPNGTSEIQSNAWILKGAGSCLPIFVRAGWRNPDRSSGFFPSTDGNIVQPNFQVCP